MSFKFENKFPEERNRIEYKSQLPDDFEEAVVAFLNYSEGGEIYIGIDDKQKKVVGVSDLDLVQRKIADKIKNNILPNTLGLFDILIEKFDGVEIIKVVVSGGMEKPYYLRKKGMSPQGCFIRVGSSNQPMTTQQIDTIYSKRMPLKLSNMKSPRQNLTFQQLEIYYSEKKLKLNDEFATSLDLIDENGLYNYAAYLLADENGVSIKVAKYAGTNKVDLIENEEYGYCCLITATNRVLEKLRVENKTFAKVTPKDRLEKKMIDETALKEAVINAIVHNDYTREVPPVVEIFSDRLTITSYGGLPPGLSRDNFFRCRSLPRNRELMRVFKDVRLVEHLGSGMGRILEAYDESIFAFEDDFLIVTFPFANGVHDSGHVGGQVGVHVSDFRGHVSGQVGGHVENNESLVEKAEKLLEFCSEPRTREEMQAHVNINSRDYFRRKLLRPLLKSLKIKMTIPDKPKSSCQKYVYNTYWCGNMTMENILKL